MPSKEWLDFVSLDRNNKVEEDINDMHERYHTKKSKNAFKNIDRIIKEKSK